MDRDHRITGRTATSAQQPGAHNEPTSGRNGITAQSFSPTMLVTISKQAQPVRDVQPAPSPRTPFDTSHLGRVSEVIIVGAIR
jgi:hypothetical protein